MITYNYPLDVVPGGVPPVIHVSKGDSNVQIAFELFARTGNFFLQSGTTVSLRGTRPDGKKAVSENAAISGNKVTIALTPEMTEVAGKGRFEVCLTNNKKELGTVNFILQVERRA